MANPMFGWSAQDVFTLVQICDRFFEAYHNGSRGARNRLLNFKEQVENCQGILKYIQNELQTGDREFFYSQLRHKSLKQTLEQSVELFEGSQFLKPQEDQNIFLKTAATVKYLWSDEGKVNDLSKILEGHIKYIQAFLLLLQNKNTQIQIAHQETHSRHLEVQTAILQRYDQHFRRFDQHFQLQGQHIQRILDILTSPSEPRWPTHGSRAQSVISMPAASPTSALIAPEIYIRGQKSLLHIQDFLEHVYWKIDDPQISDEERQVWNDVRAELEDAGGRILESMKRNEVKGIQNALQQHQEAREIRRISPADRIDSGFESIMTSNDTHPDPQPSPSLDGFNWDRFRLGSSSSITQEPLQSPRGSNWAEDDVTQSPAARKPCYPWDESTSPVSTHRGSQSSTGRQHSISSTGSNAAADNRRSSQSSVARKHCPSWNGSIGAADARRDSQSFSPRKASSSSTGSNSVASGHRKSESSVASRLSYSSSVSNQGAVLPIENFLECSLSSYTTVEICQAKILFNDGKHEPIPLPCIVRRRYRNEQLCEIFPDYRGKLREGQEVQVAPTLILQANVSRPIPHIFPRGPNTKTDPHSVQLMGEWETVPKVDSLQYNFDNAEDSENFQELVFGKKLVWEHPIKVHKIRSGREEKSDNESENVVLRLWKNQNITEPTRKGYSMLYQANRRKRKEHMEIFLDEILKLDNKGEWLQVKFKASTPAGTKLKWLNFKFDDGEEDKSNRATLAQHLDPKWLPTPEQTPDEY